MCLAPFPIQSILPSSPPPPPRAHARALRVSTLSSPLLTFPFVDFCTVQQAQSNSFLLTRAEFDDTTCKARPGQPSTCTSRIILSSRPPQNYLSEPCPHHSSASLHVVYALRSRGCALSCRAGGLTARVGANRECGDDMCPNLKEYCSGGGLATRDGWSRACDSHGLDVRPQEAV